MDTNQLLLRVEHSFAAEALNVYVFDVSGRARKVAGKVEFMEYAPGERITPTFRVSDDHVQALMDDLWRAGFRPSEEATTGQLKAMKDHVADLRMVTQELFKLLGKERE